MGFLFKKHIPLVNKKSPENLGDFLFVVGDWPFNPIKVNIKKLYISDFFKLDLICCNNIIKSSAAATYEFYGYPLGIA